MAAEFTSFYEEHDFEMDPNFSIPKVHCGKAKGGDRPFPDADSKIIVMDERRDVTPKRYASSSTSSYPEVKGSRSFIYPPPGGSFSRLATG
jgi:hypothetical protein